jgi:hypothetical protein
MKTKQSVSLVTVCISTNFVTQLVKLPGKLHQVAHRQVPDRKNRQVYKSGNSTTFYLGYGFFYSLNRSEAKSGMKGFADNFFYFQETFHRNSFHTTFHLFNTQKNCRSDSSLTKSGLNE